MAHISMIPDADDLVNLFQTEERKQPSYNQAVDTAFREQPNDEDVVALMLVRDYLCKVDEKAFKTKVDKILKYVKDKVHVTYFLERIEVARKVYFRLNMQSRTDNQVFKNQCFLVPQQNIKALMSFEIQRFKRPKHKSFTYDQEMTCLSSEGKWTILARRKVLKSQDLGSIKLQIMEDLQNELVNHQLTEKYWIIKQFEQFFDSIEGKMKTMAKKAVEKLLKSKKQSSQDGDILFQPSYTDSAIFKFIPAQHLITYKLKRYVQELLRQQILQFEDASRKQELSQLEHFDFLEMMAIEDFELSMRSDDCLLQIEPKLEKKVKSALLSQIQAQLMQPQRLISISLDHIECLEVKQHLSLMMVFKLLFIIKGQVVKHKTVLNLNQIEYHQIEQDLRNKNISLAQIEALMRPVIGLKPFKKTELALVPSVKCFVASNQVHLFSVIHAKSMKKNGSFGSGGNTMTSKQHGKTPTLMNSGRGQSDYNPLVGLKFRIKNSCQEFKLFQKQDKIIQRVIDCYLIESTDKSKQTFLEVYDSTLELSKSLVSEGKLNENFKQSSRLTKIDYSNDDQVQQSNFLVSSCSDTVLVAISSAHIIYTKLFFIQTRMCRQIDAYTLLGRDDAPQDKNGKASLTIDDAQWTQDEQFVVLAFKNFYWMPGVTLAIMIKDGSQLVQVINPTKSNWSNMRGFESMDSSKKGFLHLAGSQKTQSSYTSIKNSWTKFDSKWQISFRDQTVQKLPYAKVSQIMVVSNCLHTFEIYMSYCPEVLQHHFDILRVDLDARSPDERQLTKILQKVRVCQSFSNADNQQDLLYSLSSLFINMIPISYYERILTKYEKQFRVKKKQLVVQQNLDESGCLSELSQSMVINFQSSGAFNFGSINLMNQDKPDFQSQSQHEPIQVLKSLQKLLLVVHQISDQQHKRGCLVDNNLTMNQWLISIVQDSVQFFLSKQEPMLAYICLKISENYFAADNDPIDFLICKNLQPISENVLKLMPFESRVSDLQLKQTELHQIILNEVGQFDSQVQQIRDQNSELTAQASIAFGKKNETNLVHELQPLATPSDSHLKFQTMQNMVFDETNNTNIFMNEQFNESRPPLEAKHQGHQFRMLKNAFSQQYVSIIMYCLIQFRNYQSSHLNILYLVIANNICLRSMDATFFDCFKQTLNLLRQNYIRREKPDETEAFLGSSFIEDQDLSSNSAIIKNLKTNFMVSEVTEQALNVSEYINRLERRYTDALNHIEFTKQELSRSYEITQNVKSLIESVLKHNPIPIGLKRLESHIKSNGFVRVSSSQPGKRLIEMLYHENGFYKLLENHIDNQNSFQESKINHSEAKDKFLSSVMSQLWHQYQNEDDKILDIETIDQFTKSFKQKEELSPIERIKQQIELREGRFQQIKRPKTGNLAFTDAINALRTSTQGINQLTLERQYLLNQRYQALKEVIASCHQLVVNDLTQKYFKPKYGKIADINQAVKGEMQLRAIETINLAQAFLESDPLITQSLDDSLKFLESVPDVLFKSEVQNKLTQQIEKLLLVSLEQFLAQKPKMRNNLSDLMNSYSNFIHKKLIDFEPLKAPDDEWDRHPNQEDLFLQAFKHHMNYNQSDELLDHLVQQNGWQTELGKGSGQIIRDDEGKKYWFTNSSELMSKLKTIPIYSRLLMNLQRIKLKLYENLYQLAMTGDSLRTQYDEISQVMSQSHRFELNEQLEIIKAVDQDLPNSIKIKLLRQLSQQAQCRVANCLSLMNKQANHEWNMAQIKLFMTSWSIQNTFQASGIEIKRIDRRDELFQIMQHKNKSFADPDHKAGQLYEHIQQITGQFDLIQTSGMDLKDLSLLFMRLFDDEKRNQKQDMFIRKFFEDLKVIMKLDTIVRANSQAQSDSLNHIEQFKDDISKQISSNVKFKPLKFLYRIPQEKFMPQNMDFDLYCHQEMKDLDKLKNGTSQLFKAIRHQISVQKSRAEVVKAYRALNTMNMEVEIDQGQLKKRTFDAMIDQIYHLTKQLQFSYNTVSTKDKQDIKEHPYETWLSQKKTSSSNELSYLNKQKQVQLIVQQAKLALEYIGKELKLHLSQSDSIELQLLKLKQCLSTIFVDPHQQQPDFIHLNIVIQTLLNDQHLSSVLDLAQLETLRDVIQAKDPSHALQEDINDLIMAESADDYKEELSLSHEPVEVQIGNLRLDLVSPEADPFLTTVYQLLESKGETIEAKLMRNYMSDLVINYPHDLMMPLIKTQSLAGYQNTDKSKLQMALMGYSSLNEKLLDQNAVRKVKHYKASVNIGKFIDHDEFERQFKVLQMQGVIKKEPNDQEEIALLKVDQSLQQTFNKEMQSFFDICQSRLDDSDMLNGSDLSAELQQRPKNMLILNCRKSGILRAANMPPERSKVNGHKPFVLYTIKQES